MEILKKKPHQPGLLNNREVILLGAKIGGNKRHRDAYLPTTPMAEYYRATIYISGSTYTASKSKICFSFLLE